MPTRSTGLAHRRRGRRVAERPASSFRRRRSTGPRLAGVIFKASVFGAIGLLVLGAGLPGVTAAPTIPPTSAVEVRNADLQSMEATGHSTQSVKRDGYSVTSWSEMLRLRYGTRTFDYTTTGSGPIRWPFPTQVPISSGFGGRAAPCRGCSSNHQGLDFTPGAGAPIYAIADGTVALHEEGGGFGNHVIIEHTIDGQVVRSLYAHMQWGSSPLKEGETIAAGDFVGLVGATGQVTGNHLHFELEIDGTNVDPYVWLKSNAS